MNWNRPPAVAGTFYPGREETLRSEVEKLMADALDAVVGPGRGGGAPETPPGSPKALIVPHAGYVYSGPVAASGYSRVASMGGSVSRVILLGPAHRWHVRGLAATSAAAFETPLGLVTVDRGSVENALALDQVHLVDEAHEGEHSLEVHLPFLQVLLGDFQLVPLVVGEASPEEVAEVLEVLWGGEENLIVVSSDISHFHYYAQASEMDSATARAVVALDPSRIGYDRACGGIPMAGLMLRAREEGLSVECVDLRNSGDTAGPRDRVVGYGSFVFR